jgi:hypothetical protein
VAPFTVAIMQPYFIPYAGYFRLFSASDLFVVYDCVQFPRRGWVHRNRLVDARGKLRWLTLPLERAPRHVLIRDLRFPPNAKTILLERLRPFPLTVTNADPLAPLLLEALREVDGHPVDYIERLLKCIVTHLGLPWTVVRSSSLKLPGALYGQDRILEILRRLGASRYVNSPGGRSLYDRTKFAELGIELCFLSDYAGPSSSILTRLLCEDRNHLAASITTLTRSA